MILFVLRNNVGESNKDKRENLAVARNYSMTDCVNQLNKIASILTDNSGDISGNFGGGNYSWNKIYGALCEIGIFAQESMLDKDVLRRIISIQGKGWSAREESYRGQIDGALERIAKLKDEVSQLKKKLGTDGNK